MGKIKVQKNVGGIEGLCVIEPKVFGDSRGYFVETYNKNDMLEEGLDLEFVQDNQSSSSKGVLRGLHFQKQYPQGKLVRVIRGQVFDVAVDLRKGSETYGKWFGVVLSAENKKQFLIPRGFAHGYLTLEDDTLMQWCVDNDFCAEAARAVRYDSDFIWENESWPAGKYIISEKDQNAMILDMPVKNKM